MHEALARGDVRAGRRAALRLWVRIAAAGMLAAFVAPMAPLRLAAQEAGGFSIRVASTIAASVGSKVALPIEVGPTGAVPKGSFVTIRGLPPAASLEDGHAVGPGWWAVPLSALSSLVVQMPEGVSGRSEMVISLIALDGRLLAQSRSALAIQSASSGPGPLPPPPPVAPKLTEQQRAGAERLLARGEAYLANGNIMGARDFFERAADAGLAVAALRLAATYDPSVLKRLETQGVAADVALARKWYEHARALGSPDADEPLRRLGK